MNTYAFQVNARRTYIRQSAVLSPTHRKSSVRPSARPPDCNADAAYSSHTVVGLLVKQLTVFSPWSRNNIGN